VFAVCIGLATAVKEVESDTSHVNNFTQTAGEPLAAYLRRHDCGPRFHQSRRWYRRQTVEQLGECIVYEVRLK
jgi:hypothetical protein